MATEPDFTKTGNANCTIASEFRRWWQDSANAWRRPRLSTSHQAACGTRTVRRGSEIDRTRVDGQHAAPFAPPLISGIPSGE
jgi:hypothetical protein